jgi:hypothetical protein
MIHMHEKNSGRIDRPYFDADGHLNDGGVSFYVDALKLGSENQLPEAILVHVESCLQCKEGIVQLADALKDQSFNRMGPHPRLSTERGAAGTAVRYMRIAAGFVLLIGIAYFMYFISSADRESITETGPVDDADERMEGVDPRDDSVSPAPPESPIVPPGDRYAANFEPSLVYESLADIQYRSYGIQIHSPLIGEEVSDVIYFTGDVYYVGSVYLTILTNREEEVYTAEMDGIDHRYRVDLDPGLYYWKLESDDDLLYAGKFIVPVRDP